MELVQGIGADPCHGFNYECQCVFGKVQTREACNSNYSQIKSGTLEYVAKLQTQL